MRAWTARVAVAMLATVLTAMVLGGCAPHGWLLPPGGIVTRASARRIVVLDDLGNEHDLGRGRWGRTGNGIDVLSVPSMPHGQLLCQLEDGRWVRTEFDRESYDDDLDGTPNGLDPTPRPVFEPDDDDDFDEDMDESMDESRERDDRRERREEARRERMEDDD